MAIVRIYKEHEADELQVMGWQVRSNGCTLRDAADCSFGDWHDGYCDGFFEYIFVLKHLNDPSTELGAYISK